MSRGMPPRNKGRITVAADGVGITDAEAEALANELEASKPFMHERERKVAKSHVKPI